MPPTHESPAPQQALHRRPEAPSCGLFRGQTLRANGQAQALWAEKGRLSKPDDGR